jgi:arginine repressor
MLTDHEQKVINWLRKTKVATMRHLRHQFQISHMTVVRALKKFGYYASYNHNAAYYVLQNVPEFDDWGLWAYRDIYFSRYRSLPETIVSVVEKAPAGLTVRELEERLQTRVANLVSGLVSKGRVRRERLVGRQVVYLAGDPAVRTPQLQQRRLQEEEAVRATSELPPACSATGVIEILRAMILTQDDNPDRLSRRLQARGTRVTASQVRRVLDHYALEKKRRR